MELRLSGLALLAASGALLLNRGKDEKKPTRAGSVVRRPTKT